MYIKNIFAILAAFLTGGLGIALSFAPQAAEAAL